MMIKFGILKRPKFGDFATFINPKFVPSLDVVEFAAKKALSNWEKRRISKSLAIEILLHYAATRQINIAKKLSGNSGEVVAVIIDERKFSEIEFEEVDFKPRYDLEAIMKHYEITKEELEIVSVEKLPLLIRERIALFSAFGE